MDDRDPDAFRQLYGTHYATVRRYLAARTHADQVDDLTAETFLVAWRRFGAVPDHTLPWLLNVAAKQLANQRRGSDRARALTEQVTLLAMQEATRGAALDVEVDAERRTQRQALVAALATLSEQDRELMLLHVWEDLPAREIAVVLELGVVATRARLSRARRRLEGALRRELAPDRRPPTSVRTSSAAESPVPTSPTTNRNPA